MSAAAEEPAEPIFADAPAAARTDAPPGEAVDEGRGRVFPCDQCGADLEFHIGVQHLKCPYCGFEKSLAVRDDLVCEQDFHAMLAKIAEHRREGGPETTGASEVRCEGCGGTTVFTGTLTSSECPYCGTPLQRDKVHDHPRRVPVDGVLGFLVPQEKARQHLAEWVRSRWFAPSEFLSRGVEGRFSGIYLPYWTFDSMTATVYQGERGDHYYVETGTGDQKRRERRTRWSPAAGHFQRFFDDVLVLGSKGLSTGLLEALEPWPLHKCRPFTPEFLSGFLARTYDVELDQAFPIARRRMDEALAIEVRQRIGGDEQRVHDLRSRYDAITYKLLLLPVWLLAYRYHDRVYQVTVNATTGEVQGERPWSWVKITLAVAAGLVAAAVVAYFANRS